jgi:phosphatidate cytidylyltransferase
MAPLDPPPAGSRSWARHADAAPEPYLPDDDLTVEAAIGDLHLAPSGSSASPPSDPSVDDARSGDSVDGEAPSTRGRRRAGRGQPGAGGQAGRAGRNLPAAIGVGVLLGGTVLASLLLWRPAFFVVLALAVGVGTWEMVRAVNAPDAPAPAQPPLLPLLAGGLVMNGLAWYGGAATLPLGLFATLLAVLLWRLADGPAGYQRDVTAGALIAVYVPFLASFAALLARAEDGDFRVLVTLLAVVLSDTGGYAFGVLFGRHPMAPTVSPKKSWEGFVGSLVCTAAGSAVAVHYLFDGAAWWIGAVFGLAVSGASVLGDLAESLIKRDLRVKDMSSLLPGHGGLMDRLDSILLAAPTGYAVLVFLLP